jgi:hypothetical protein
MHGRQMSDLPFFLFWQHQGGSAGSCVTGFPDFPSITRRINVDGLPKMRYACHKDLFLGACGSSKSCRVSCRFFCAELSEFT